jgi:predicted O-methyltransferase YrrM
MFSAYNYNILNSSLHFNHIWFTTENINPILTKFKDVEDIHFLEIGSFEGFSANYFTRNFLTGKNCSLTCIDPWIKYSESTVNKISGFDNVMNEETYTLFSKNIEDIKDKIIVKRGLSKDILPILERKYHFIFIDGDHSADAVYIDGVLSFDKIIIGGYILFDDYNWEGGNEIIQKFLKEYEQYIKVICINSQVMIQKISEK